MSEMFYHELPGVFQQFTTKRENVFVKGKGHQTTYLLNKIDRDQPIRQISTRTVTGSTHRQSADGSHADITVMQPGNSAGGDSHISGIDSDAMASSPDMVLDNEQAMPLNIRPMLNMNNPSIEIPGIKASSFNDHLQPPPPLSTIPETAGFFGLITHTEEEDSVMAFDKNDEDDDEGAEGADNNSARNVMPLLGLQKTEGAKTATQSNESGGHETDADQQHIAIRVDPPDMSTRAKSEPQQMQLNASELQKQRQSLNATNAASPRSGVASLAAAGPPAISRMKSRRNRKMKLASSKRNLFTEADNKSNANTSDAPYHAFNDNKMKQQKKGKKRKEMVKSPSKEEYKAHRRNQSFKGLWALAAKRNSSADSADNRKSSRSSRRISSTRNSKKNNNRFSGNKTRLMDEEDDGDETDEKLKSGHNRRATSSHQRSKSTPFGPDVDAADDKVKTGSLGLLRKRQGSEKALTPSADSKRPHKYAVKMKMAKKAQEKLTTPTTNTEEEEEEESKTATQSQRMETTEELRKFAHALKNRNTVTNTNTMKAAATNHHTDARESYLLDARMAVPDDDGDESASTDVSEAPSVTEEYDDQAPGISNKPLTIMADAASPLNVEMKADRKPNVSHALVVDNDDDLFTAQEPSENDELFSNSDMMINIGGLNDSQTNGGRITPPAASTPSAPSSEATGTTNYSSVDAQKRVSSVQPNLESVPEGSN